MWLSPEKIDTFGFKLGGTVRHGGQSLVYRAFHHATDEFVALKIYAPDTPDSEAILREAAVMANVSHPHVARLVSVGYIDKCAYVALQWIEGLSLQDRVAQTGGLTVKQALSVINQLASALSALHSRLLIHGDLSLTNIMIDEHDHCTLIDFGLSRTTDACTAEAQDDITGTLRYLAPECIQGQSTSPLSDQYALAVMGYELLSGDWPYPLQTITTYVSSPGAMLHHHIHTPAVALSERMPEVNTLVDDVFLTALSKQPCDRFGTVEKMSEALIHAWYRKSSKTLPLRQRTLLRSAGISLLVFGVGLGVLSIADGIDSESVPEHIAGTVQTELECNLMPNPDFENILANNFYMDSDSPDVVSIVEDSELDGPALRVGSENQYGLYGQIVKIEPKHVYRFSAILHIEGWVEQAQLSVGWLDAQWQPIKAPATNNVLEAILRIENHRDSAIFDNIVPPKDARYAVPTIFKNGSPGVLWVNALRFRALSCFT